jgi:hypothetical protein
MGLLLELGNEAEYTSTNTNVTSPNKITEIHTLQME